MGKTTTELPPPMTLTVTQLKRKKRDLAMLDCYVHLLREEPGRSRTLLNQYLMRRFSLASQSAFYDAMKRALADPDTPPALVREYGRLTDNK